MATPDSRNISVGTGEVFFNRFDASGNPTGFRHLGNVSKLAVTPSVTTIEKKSAMNAARGTLARVPTETVMNLSMTLDEFDPANIALALLGDASILTQSSATKSDTALGNAVLGQYLRTGYLGITVTAVKKASTTLVLGTDYIVDTVTGMIKILDTSVTVSAGDAITWSGSVPAQTYPKVEALINGKIEGALMYRPSNDTFGPKLLVDLHRVQLNPDGDLNFLSDTFAEIPMAGAVLFDSTQPSGEEYARVVKLP